MTSLTILKQVVMYLEQYNRYRFFFYVDILWKIESVVRVIPALPYEEHEKSTLSSTDKKGLSSKYVKNEFKIFLGEVLLNCVYKTLCSDVYYDFFNM